MSTCKPCQAADHTAEQCENSHKPLCAQDCTCLRHLPERDPAPYWTQQQETH